MPAADGLTATTLPTSAPLDLGGFEVQAERWSGAGRARVLLIHGLGGNSVTWHGVAPVLARELAAEVLAVDLPGFGRTRTRGRRVNLSVLGGVLEALLARESPPGERWLIAGNSLGAVLALGVARRAPERVRGLSLVAPALPLLWGRGLRGVGALASWVPASLPRLGGRLVGRYMVKTGLPGVVDEPIRALFGDARRLDPTLRERLLAVSGYRLGWAFEAARAYEQVTRSLGINLLSPGGTARWIRTARCPVQVIHGSRDPIFPAGPRQKLARVRPDWSYSELADIGHVPQLEAPTEVADSIAQWAAGLVTSPRDPP
jgi:pimeloyl-ACP methyl ester carboxylesterase